MSRVSVTHELNDVVNTQHLLEPLSNLLKHLLALLGSAALLAWGGLARSTSPEADTVEGLTDVDDDTHDLVVALVLELLTNGGKEHVQPDVIVGLALLEGVGPAASVLVLRVLPLRTDAAFEEVVVGLLGELGSGGDVVLGKC